MTDKNLSELISSSYNGGNLIDDTANTTTNVWSGVKISNELNSIVIPDTDLSLLANGSAIELQSSTGNNVTIFSANSSTAGLLSAEAQTIAGDKTFTGTITYSSTLDSNLIPELDITYDLGTANNRWRDLYLSGNTINLGDAQIKADEATGTIALIPPVTASNPHPKAMVLNARGRMQMLDTTAGIISSQSITEVANIEDNIFESVTVTGHVNANTFVGDGSDVTNVDAVTLQGNTVADLRQYADNAAANVSVDLTGYATETYVSNAVSSLVDSAPTTLDTLNELAAALGDDPNFATTVSNQIGTKLDANTWTNSTASSITANNVSNWNTAYGWGDHALAGYLTSFTESDPTVPAHVKSITTTNVSNWNTAYGWGDHASAGYQAAATAITTSNIGSQSVNFATSAGTATTLAAARTINGVSFNGSANITVADATKLPLTGGTLSGTLTATGDQRIVNQDNGTTAAWRGRILSKNSSSDKASFLGNYASITGVFAHNNALTAWADLYVNTVDGNSGGNVRLPSTTLIAGNQSIHAGNYNTYAPTKTGGGASGTWGINVTGNATTAGGLAVHTGTNNEANKIVRTQVNGYIMAGWINTISGDNGTTAPDRIYASSDGYIRYYTPANFRQVLDLPTRTGGSASGTWGINVTGNAGSVTNGVYTTGNQSIGGVKTFTSTGPYTNDWFRNNTSGYGLYNQSTARHFYSPGTSYWHIDGASTVGGLIFYDRYNGSQGNATGRRGYVYYDSSGFGLLHQNGGWAVRTTSSLIEIYNRLDAPIMYDSNNTGYYVDPASTSSLNVVNLAGLLTSKTNTVTFTSANDTTLSVRGNTSWGAIMSFHRTGAYAVNFGLDTDNHLKMGGWSAGSVRHTWQNNGNYIATGNVTAFSDRRIKDNIETIDDALSKLMQLRGVYYTRTDTDDNSRHTGVIAQEVLPVLPEVVLGSEEDHYAVAYGNMVGLLIEGIKEQQSTITSLEDRINKLENLLEKFI